jgi:hypothetical protein
METTNKKNEETFEILVDAIVQDCYNHFLKQKQLNDKEIEELKRWKETALSKEEVQKVQDIKIKELQADIKKLEKALLRARIDLKMKTIDDINRILK